MRIQQVLTAITAAGILAATFALPAAAQNWVVKIVNQTGYVMVRFYGSNKGSKSWEEDILGTDVLGGYESININFDDNTGYCIFDFKAVFSDGEEVVSKGINVCEIPSFTYN
ncbi:MAG: hypothetical protein JKY41_15675 [Rhodobacteraceae bacterium]|nr:hypothetical protein [Paracoccaceae bacterium]